MKRAIVGAVALAAAAWLAADDAPPEAALAAQLLALPDAAAREAWLEAHTAQVTAGLGRELEAQSRVLLHAGKYPEATSGFETTVRVGELAGDPTSRIRGLHDIGEVHRLQGRPTEAVSFLERATQEAVAADDRAAVARITGSAGHVRLSLGEYGEALAMFERQRATFESLGDVRGRGQAESNVGIALGTIGRFEEAAEAFTRARELYEASGYTSGIPRTYNNLGRAHFNLGNYGLALEELSRSLELKLRAGNSSELPSTLRGLGEVHLAQGAAERALEYFRRGYTQAASLGQKPEMGQLLHSQAQALLALERPREAIEVLDRSIAISLDAQELATVDASTAVLALAHAALGERPLAVKLLESSLESSRKRGDLRSIAALASRLAGLRLEEGQPAEALALAQEGVDLARRCGIPDDLWLTLLAAARAHKALGNRQAAESTLREAASVVEAMRTQTVGPDADRAVFFESRAAVFQELVALLAEDGRAWEALAVAERSKGRVLLDTLSAGRSSIAPALSAQERGEELRLERALLTVNTELRDLRLRAAPEAERLQALERLRDARRLAVEEFSTQVYAAHPELRVLRGESPPVVPTDLRELLAGDTLLLEFTLTPSQAYLFAVSTDAAGEPALALHRLGPASELVRLARDLRARLAARDLDYAGPSARLHEALLGPVKDALRRARRVVVVPDGALWELPFQALRPTGGRHLIERVAIAYAPSLAVLRDMRARRSGRARSAGELLALGNPDLGPVAARRTPSALMDAPLAPLPQAERQVQEIARLYDPAGTKVQVGAAARESWLKTQAPGFRILHLATHGVLDDASPLYSALVLAKPTSGEHDDGLLEAREVLGLDLHADLAVLSACETGRGRAGAGEGLIGTTWAFFVAGCPTTVASQWKVEAASTNRLMLAFHRELRAGRPPAEALRLAAVAQLRQGQRHPFYWAGFVAVGDAYAPLEAPAAPR